jgi:hypothetical protein
VQNDTNPEQFHLLGTATSEAIDFKDSCFLKISGQYDR